MAEAHGILKIIQNMEKAYSTSVITDTPSLGMIALCAEKLVDTILSLLHAKVSTIHPCVCLVSQLLTVYTEERQAEVEKACTTSYFRTTQVVVHVLTH